MRYTRLATFILVAGLGLSSGCQSSNSCGCSSSSSSGGLMSRLGLSRTRSTPCCDSGVVGTPVSSMPYGEIPYGGSYEGPTLGDPTFMGSPGTIMPSPTTVPPPVAGSEAVPRQLPGTLAPGTATPAPAGPSSRFRN